MQQREEDFPMTFSVLSGRFLDSKREEKQSSPLSFFSAFNPSLSAQTSSASNSAAVTLPSPPSPPPAPSHPAPRIPNDSSNSTTAVETLRRLLNTQNFFNEGVTREGGSRFTVSVTDEGREEKGTQPFKIPFHLSNLYSRTEEALGKLTYTLNILEGVYPNLLSMDPDAETKFNSIKKKIEKDTDSLSDLLRLMLVRKERWVKKTQKFLSEFQRQDKQKICPICTEEIQEGVLVLPCCRQFICSACFSKHHWESSKEIRNPQSQCPYCKTKVGISEFSYEQGPKKKHSEKKNK